jgi:protein SCO1/2
VDHQVAQPLELRHGAALGAVAFIVAVTGAWWALALWPVPGDVPRWLAVTRAACFGSAPNGLPAPAGWMLLLGQPPAMLIALMLIAGEALPGGFRLLASRAPGRLTLAGGGTLVLAGLVAAGVRVARASGMPAEAPVAAGAWEGVSLPAPALGLTDQRGETVTVERLRGRPALVTFAFGHCATVCPTVVREVQQARTLAADQPTALVIVTLDPWRDTPGRLPAIAAAWGLDADAHLLGGSVEQVEAALGRWDVPRARDPLTGDVTHGTPVYLLAADGRIAYRATAVADTIARLLRTLGTDQR